MVKNSTTYLGTRNSDYGRAVAYRKQLAKKGIEVGREVDIHEPPYEESDWKGPYIVSQIVRGGRVQVKGRNGQFSPYRIRLHVSRV